jgi:regulator of protease activity HflC (stomatin/prohibitin superfamily)
LVTIGWDVWSLKDLKDDVKTIKEDMKAQGIAQASRADAQATRTDAQATRTDALYTALLDERKLQAEASKKADERYFGLLEEVKDIKRKAWW